MNLKCIFISLLLLLHYTVQISGQSDTDPPAPPVLNLVTVNSLTGKPDLVWIKSPSPDVAGYVIYYYKNGEGFAIDTIYDPLLESYTNMGSFAEFRIESYVIAALDNSGNVSPLSNVLSTIFASSRLDSCNKKIVITWNNYSSTPLKVKSYHVLSSKDGSPFQDEATVSAGSSSYQTNNFTTGSNYCFYIKAELEGGTGSYSSKTCLKTNMQRPPDWLNADYATISDNQVIDLSFTIDPQSEIHTYGIERKPENDQAYSQITTRESSGNKVVFSDKSANPLMKQQYRLAALNNCGLPVAYSNPSGNIVLNISADNDQLIFSWNSNRGWRGGTEKYKIFMNTGSSYIEKEQLPAADTAYTLNYSDIMYDISAGEVCFYVRAYEKTNEFNISGESSSNVVCSSILEKITVPTAFTPDNDLTNDLFKPVLSFTPSTYKLTISDRRNNVVFETTDYLATWDGTRGGSELPQAVYLWYLKTTAPSGRTYSKSGTVTIIRNK